MSVARTHETPSGHCCWMLLRLSRESWVFQQKSTMKSYVTDLHCKFTACHMRWPNKQAEASILRTRPGVWERPADVAQECSVLHLISFPNSPMSHLWYLHSVLNLSIPHPLWIHGLRVWFQSIRGIAHCRRCHQNLSIRLKQRSVRNGVICWGNQTITCSKCLWLTHTVQGTMTEDDRSARRRENAHSRPSTCPKQSSVGLTVSRSHFSRHVLVTAVWMLLSQNGINGLELESLGSQWVIYRIVS